MSETRKESNLRKRILIAIGLIVLLAFGMFLGYLFTKIAEEQKAQAVVMIPTKTIAPIKTPVTPEPAQETPILLPTVTLAEISETQISTEKVVIGTWKISYLEGATEVMKEWTFPNLAPEVWPEFPNVDNGSYLASQGLEYAEDLTTFCQFKETCDFVVPARHYRLYTGDYKLSGVGECIGEGRKGCALAVFNVGEVTASFEDQWFDAGFTVWGRYWDGAYLSQAVWALLSHAANNMLNMDSKINPSVITNAGANCSIPEGCLSVEATFVVISGNEILMVGRQTIQK
jgi:hypothetical protein